MKEKKFLEALGDVDDKYVEEAMYYSSEQKYRRMLWIAMAACMFFLVAQVMLGGFGRGTNSPTNEQERNEMELRTDGELLYYVNLEDENQWYSYDIETGEHKKAIGIEIEKLERDNIDAYVSVGNELYYSIENVSYTIPLKERQNKQLRQSKIILVGEYICVVFYDVTGQSEKVEIQVYALQ